MFNVGDKVINRKTGGTATITRIDLNVETHVFRQYKVFRTYYTLKGNQHGREIKLDEDKFHEFFKRGQLELFTDELKPKRHNLTFSFINSW